MCDAREAGVWGFLSAGETFLTSVEWVDGEFPVFKDVKIKQRTKRQVARKTDTKGPVGVHLKSPATLYLRTPLLENYRQDGDEIVLTATDAGFGSPDGTMTFVGRRQTSLGSAASVTIILSSATSENVSYGLALYKDVFRYAAIQYKVHDSTLAVVVQEAGQPLITMSSHPVQDAVSIRLSITSSVEAYKCGAQICFASAPTTDIALGEVPCSAMSGDDFTGIYNGPPIFHSMFASKLAGTVYGIFASGDGNTVTFRDFEIESK